MAAEPEKPNDDAETVFMPSRPPTTGPTPARPRTLAEPPAGRVSIGDILNGIYEVKRLIGRGGMGEVYEGININSDERVAIKVMLPSLAADAKVQAMFRKEARTLTRLAHPAVVQYRVLAHEPQLNVLYIVTEFVDGVELSDVLGQIHPTSAELKSLMRRLADGLRAAHDLGAVHRDMSPDNILLPERRLDRARIIDFGIAKDLDPTKATIVGEGFAGKLAYVAPEQFGDYGREIGPWTDIYSLGLVILAVATGRDVDMGTTLVEAVDKRRAGIDLTPIPEDLRPVLDRMLQADPAKRARSMDEVLAMLGEPGHTFPPTDMPPHPVTFAPTAAPAAAPLATSPPTTSPPTSSPPVTSAPVSAAPATSAPVTSPPATSAPVTSAPVTIAPAASAPSAAAQPAAAAPPRTPAARPAAPAQARSLPIGAIVIGAIAVLVVIGTGVAYVMMPKTGLTARAPAAAPAHAGQGATTGVQAPAAQTLSAGDAINGALPGMSCSWLDVVGQVQNGAPVKLAGAAGSPATVQDAVIAAAKSAGVDLPVTAVDLTGVAQADQGACSALDAFRSFKSAGAPGLISPAASYTIARGPDGKLAGQPTITLAPRNPSQDFALLHIDPLGRIAVIYGSRQAFSSGKDTDAVITSQGGDAYSIQDGALNANGWNGLLMIIGAGPFDASMLTKAPAARDVGWIDQVRQAAAAGGWKSSMVWYQVRNNAAPAPVRTRPRPTQGYYAHPGVSENSGNGSEPIQTAPPSPYPPLHRNSIWQRMFGGNGNPQR
ncbi:MAG TPA: serine/threonine-protein kinase [Caulobacteraceae bacterium]|nr:serine/threonine-protein kinase [Caulobacteraceae bacterium]